MVVDRDARNPPAETLTLYRDDARFEISVRSVNAWTIRIP
jgi:hypothetical protein